MAEIINTKKEEDRLVCEVAMGYDEALQLKGHLSGIRLFSEEVIERETNLSQRGKNSATKYFLIPRDMRRGLKFNSKVTCQRVNTDSKIFFIYVMDNRI